MKLKTKKQLEKIKPKSGSLGRVIQLTKTPATQRKKKREEAKMTRIRNQRRNITTELTDMEQHDEGYYR